MRIGSILTGKIVIYPIIDNVDDHGNQLVNWMAEIKRDTFEQNDRNKPGNLTDFIPLYESWRFDGARFLSMWGERCVGVTRRFCPARCTFAARICG